MNLLQKFISIFLIQIFGLFIVNPLFANSDSNFVLSSNSLNQDSCTKNIQCYEVGENKYACSESESGIASSNAYINNIQIGKNDIISTKFSKGNQEGFLICYHNQDIFYESPEGYIYPFVGIIKIQV